MKLVIVGGETHVGEVTRLAGHGFEIAATCMRADQRAKALPDSAAPNFASEDEMLARLKPDLAAISNENDLKAAAVMKALRAGCDVIADKPLCLTMEEQSRLEQFLTDHPERRLLNLLTLRGNPLWAGLRRQVRSGAIGRPAMIHVRMAVRLKRASRPAWFLDVRRSGGLFLDLLIHGLDQVEWLGGARIRALTAAMGNLGNPADPNLRDHASVFCELDGGATAIVEGQRLLPNTQDLDYRVLIAGTEGMAELIMAPPALWITNARQAGQRIEKLPEMKSVVADWLHGGDLVPQADSLRANRLAIQATVSAERHTRMVNLSPGDGNRAAPTIRDPIPVKSGFIPRSRSDPTTSAQPERHRENTT